MSQPTPTVFVLSGGAARGAVQVGMMQTLASAGILPDALVGTSVGALNSVFVAANPSLERINELADRWQSLHTRDIFPGGTLSRLSHLARRLPYLYSSAALRQVVTNWVKQHRLEELPTPVKVVTTSLTTAQAVYHRTGELATLLLASAAVPGVFAPVPIHHPDGRAALHVDGGIADLVPVNGAVSFSPHRVFVLDASIPPQVRLSRNPLDVLITSLSVAMRIRQLPQLDSDVELYHLRAPDLGTRMTDFSRTAEHLHLGRQAAEKVLRQVFRTAPETVAGNGSHQPLVAV